MSTLPSPSKSSTDAAPKAWQLVRRSRLRRSDPWLSPHAARRNYPTILNTEKVERAIERSSLAQRGGTRRRELPFGRAPDEGIGVLLHRPSSSTTERGSWLSNWTGPVTCATKVADGPDRRAPSVLTGAVMVAAVATGGAGAASASARKAPVVRPAQELARLLTPHRLRSAPHARASRIGKARARRPITGGQTVIPVIGHATTEGGAHWLKVMVARAPKRIERLDRAGRDRATTTSWYVVVRTNSRRVRVYQRGRPREVVRRNRGQAVDTDSPREFFVEESVRMRPGVPGRRSPSL